MMTTPQEAEEMSKEELYQRLLDTEVDRNNLREYIRTFTGGAAMERQAQIVRDIRKIDQQAHAV